MRFAQAVAGRLRDRGSNVSGLRDRRVTKDGIAFDALGTGSDMDILCDERIARSFLLCLVLTSVSLGAFGAALNPYSLPSQQRATPAPDTRAAEPAAARSKTIPDSYYEKFAAQAKTLKSDQRITLQRSFSQNRDQALQSGRVEEAQHYSRLVQILDATK